MFLGTFSWYEISSVLTLGFFIWREATFSESERCLTVLLTVPPSSLCLAICCMMAVEWQVMERLETGQVISTLGPAHTLLLVKITGFLIGQNNGSSHGLKSWEKNLFWHPDWWSYMLYCRRYELPKVWLRLYFTYCKSGPRPTRKFETLLWVSISLNFFLFFQIALRTVCYVC